jgi:dynein heavy chain
MASTVTLLFEISKTDHASPTTVLRAGMIYIPPYVLGWHPISESWVKADDFLPLRSNFPTLVDSLENVLAFLKKFEISDAKESSSYCLFTFSYF